VNHSSELGELHPCQQTEILCEIYDRLAVSSSHSSLIDRATSAVLYMVDRDLDAEWVADLPHGLALPILEMIRTCQTHPPADWLPKAYAFVGRTDLATQSLGEMTVSKELPMLLVS